MSAKNILAEVHAERVRQEQKGFDAAHDDHHEFAYFRQALSGYVSWGGVMFEMCDVSKARRRLVQVAALAVATVEWIDRRTTTPKRGGMSPYRALKEEE